MDIIELNQINHIYCNISNEVVYDYYTMVITSAEYTVTVTLDAPISVNDRYVTFQLEEGTEDLINGSIALPNNGDYPYEIINAETLSGTSGISIHNGILRLKEQKEVVYSYTNEQNTYIYE